MEDGRSNAGKPTTDAGTVVGVAGEKESEREEQAGVGAVAQAPQHQQSCLFCNWKEKICNKRYNCEFQI